jgi:Ca2+/Na+ antiporter
MDASDEVKKKKGKKCMDDGKYGWLWSQHWGVTALLVVCWETLVLYTMNRVSSHLTRSLLGLAKRTDMDSSTAGMLLLNIGNSIPDFISGAVACSIDKAILIDASLGSFLFLISVVVGSAIVFSRQKERVPYRGFYKTMFFLIGSLGLILRIYIAGEISLSMSFVLVTTYALFVYITLKCIEQEEELVEGEVSGRKERGVGRIIMGPVTFLLDTALLSSCRRRVKRFFSPVANFVFFSLVWGYGRRMGALIPGLCVSLAMGGVLVMRYSLVDDLYTFAVAILWLYVLSEEFIGFPMFVAKKLGVGSTIISFTAIAWGNSLGDLFMAITAARKGMVQLSIITALTAPVQSILFNLGAISLVRHMFGERNLFFYASSPLPKYGLIFSIVSFAVLLTHFEFRKGRFDPEAGVFLYAVYAMFLCACAFKPPVE